MYQVNTSPTEKRAPRRHGSRAAAAVPSGTASLAAAVGIVFTALGTPYTRGELGYAALTATVVSLGAGHTLVALARSPRRTVAQWLAAVGGLLILLLGINFLVLGFINVRAVGAFSLRASLIGVPIATCLCYLGGLAQLPARWWLPLVSTTVGATVVGYEAVQADLPRTRVIAGVAALCALVGAVTTCCFLRGRPTSWRVDAPRILAGISAAITAVVMVYAVAVAAIPEHYWPHYAPSSLLAWGYISAGLLASLAGLIYDLSRPLPARPPAVQDGCPQKKSVAPTGLRD